MTSTRKVRYAVVALGDISQEAMLPAIAHTGNSELAAVVSGDAEKGREVAARYGVKAWGYDGFEALLGSGEIDAIYLGSPNWRHAEFAVPALEAGIHVLCEKPLEVSSERGREIEAAAKASTAKFMTAYRLHFEPSTLAAIRRIRSGELGEIVAFTSCFTQALDPANHRARNGELAGPLFDMAPYPINAARYLFGEEPEAVLSAHTSRTPEAGLELDVDTVAVALRFPKGRIATFTVSYAANAVDSLVVAGTKGSIHMSPAYGFGDPGEQTVKVGGKEKTHGFKATDQFGGELRHFSRCILEDRDPEPDAEEGLADLRVIEGVRRCLETGAVVELAPFTRSRRIDVDAQEETLHPVHPPEPIGASAPARKG